jgi:hypothetical protein
MSRRTTFVMDQAALLDFGQFRPRMVLPAASPAAAKSDSTLTRYLGVVMSAMMAEAANLGGGGKKQGGFGGLEGGAAWGGGGGGDKPFSKEMKFGSSNHFFLKKINLPPPLRSRPPSPVLFPSALGAPRSDYAIITKIN